MNTPRPPFFISFFLCLGSFLYHHSWIYCLLVSLNVLMVEPVLHAWFAIVVGNLQTCGIFNHCHQRRGARGQLECCVFVDNSDKWIAQKWKQRKTSVTLWSETSPEAFPTINFKEYLTVTDEHYSSRKPKIIDKQLVFRPKQHSCNHKKERLAAEQLVFLTEKSNRTSILASIEARNLEETHFQ